MRSAISGRRAAGTSPACVSPTRSWDRSKPNGCGVRKDRSITTSSAGSPGAGTNRFCGLASPCGRHCTIASRRSRSPAIRCPSRTRSARRSAWPTSHGWLHSPSSDRGASPRMGTAFSAYMRSAKPTGKSVTASTSGAADRTFQRPSRRAALSKRSRSKTAPASPGSSATSSCQTAIRSSASSISSCSTGLRRPFRERGLHARVPQLELGAPGKRVGEVLRHLRRHLGQPVPVARVLDDLAEQRPVPRLHGATRHPVDPVRRRGPECVRHHLDLPRTRRGGRRLPPDARVRRAGGPPRRLRRRPPGASSAATVICGTGGSDCRARPPACVAASTRTSRSVR